MLGEGDDHQREMPAVLSAVLIASALREHGLAEDFLQFIGFDNEAHLLFKPRSRGFHVGKFGGFIELGRVRTGIGILNVEIRKTGIGAEPRNPRKLSALGTHRKMKRWGKLDLLPCIPWAILILIWVREFSIFRGY